MPISPFLMRTFLATGLVSMALLAVAYLRQRRLTLNEAIGWGILAIMVPLVGPFLVIMKHPGDKLPPQPRRRRRRSILEI